ncbi:sodium:alanine symporter family protein [Halalkalibacterium halodurans]|uniref:Sodium:alanine symporter n=1 Tax=Halalkalibacterium halodurans TaxID=86665 RepID=A0A0M0KMN5_ALKHA|nr:sodium:alanine symporter family protein [Halalkalibacterium halodurans]MED4080522.1 sodium:alanine symporter family protein [Halalkalibacterium halodurans]MED4083913.1 sodium:alanine symporter family protein [Halalkalibacterium halodurans]MED4105550.1 sodium:alanine symporter family protein [Halalkalibacterium halodurans]MED4109244.1 sodium:alanine symporter family protein [Halalkalibacterium halodurans]MED4122465.1 sodium:alanine symporter family protein [Halalkalibacterium halodurans]
MLQQLIDGVNGFLWTYVVIGGLLGLGVYFTFRTNFVQFRYLKEMIRVLFDPPKDGQKGKSISSFKSFCIGAATRIGTGNLAGVAVAITVGGPGAVFWMWLVALLGGATSFIESTLAQVYKIKDKEKSVFRGGPAYYIEKGLGMRWLGIMFAVLIAITFGLIFNSVQSNTIAEAFNNAFGIPTWLMGVIITVLTGAIIFGGVHRIANVSSVIVPVMALLYITIAAIVVIMNISQVPAAISLIIQSAFGLEQAIGGGIGAAIMQGVRRGLFSNEAGMGSAPNAAAVADVTHPAKQGFIQTLGVFVDTLIVCTATAFIIIMAEGFGTSTEAAGITLLQDSLSSHIGPWASIFVAIAIFLFAFSSIIGSYYYGETNIEFIKKSQTGVLFYRLATMGLVMFGANASLGLVWDLADVFMALMTVINLVGIALLGRVAFKVLKDYETQRKQGLDPTFSPSKLGIENTECWDEDTSEERQVG